MHRKALIIIMAVIMTVVAAGCSQTAEHTGSQIDPSEPVKVLVSILPQADFVKSIGGEQVEVNVLIPPGANPENYEMSPRQIQEVSQADVYFTIGSIPFEQISLERIRSANPDMPVIDTAEDREYAEGEEAHHHDPHVWLSPVLVKEQARIICTGLSEIDPAHKEMYDKNLNTYIAELEKLDKDIKLLLADRKRDAFLVYHPAWGYFAEDYGLHEMAVEKEGKEPTAKEMAQIIAEAKQEGVTAVIASPQHSTRSAETIAKQLQGEVKMIDPLPEDYIAGMREAAAVFKQVLSDQEE